MSTDRAHLPPVPGVKPAAPALPVPGRKPVLAQSAPAVPKGGEEVSDAIRAVAGLSGHSFSTLLAQATQESGLNTKAKNPKSTAVGPFPFIERTWLDMVRRHGSAYGLGDMAREITVHNGVPTVKDPAVRKQILALREDPHVSAGMAARHLAEGREALQKRLDRPVTETESRIAYVMGVAGAAKLIKAAEKNPDALARDLLPAAAKANKPLFYAEGRALPVREMIARLSRRMEADASRLASLVPAEPEGARDDRPAPVPGSLILVQEAGAGSV
jgi:hypothetical protein